MDYYLLFVLVLFVLAIADLVVGVSNDAVNFLNSAVGSRVAPRVVIMIVASLGIFLGAAFSSGMMEIARKGIFNPHFFSFAEVMVIFVAVMFTDIILLDLFNTFGMPTSTTVSIVFELLGAALAVAVFKIVAAGGSIAEVSNYINSSKALAIISGIFLSVFVAFLIGALAQYFSRLLFSFQYERRLRYVGGLWAGFAVTALSYFLLIKGLKGASFVSADFLGWVQANTVLLLLGSLVVWTAVMQGLLLLKVNILKIVVLLGTFSLAMAFAGNDLVNFIGVPVAGLASFRDWAGSGIAADSYVMEALNAPVRTDTGLLLLAGLVMVLALWFSKKARSVTETEVNLGRQDAGYERFTPNGLARAIVRVSRDISQVGSRLMPLRWKRRAEINFLLQPNPNRPAFDLVRASVNLTIASVLIALATSWKLPLSTTYVSFMVAMGTSLSDRAWDRDSAVYRVAGVLNVIGGWFLTALIALSVSALFACLLYLFKMWALVGLLAFVGFSVVRSMFVHRRQEQERTLLTKMVAEPLPVSAVLDDTTTRVAQTLETIADAYDAALTGLLTEDRKQIAAAQASVATLEQQTRRLGSGLHRYVQQIEEEHAEGSKTYIAIYDFMQDSVQSCALIVQVCDDHVRNSHHPPQPNQAAALRALQEVVQAYLCQIVAVMQDRSFEDIDWLLREKQHLLTQIEDVFERQVAGIKAQHYSTTNSLLLFSLLLETKDLVAVAARFVKHYHRHFVFDQLEKAY